ncbi:MAG: hypothetical protein GX957_01990 [Clostridiaceae bacterium]|nr:hypothetical protein [Clostridiaceae bacterium]
MKKVAILCVIFLPVFLLAVHVDGNLFDYSEQIGNKAIDGVKDITDKVANVSDKVSIFVSDPDFSISDHGGLIGWIIGDKSTVTEGTVSKADFLKALEWEYAQSNIKLLRYMGLYIKYSFKSKGFYKINDDITFSLNNPFIYPPEQE